MRASALALAARGLPVFPCKPGEKMPATEHGHLDATVDVETIKERWTETSGANIGLRCDASGFVVVDVDAKNGGYKTLEALEAELGPCPDTVAARTGCRQPGLHLYYRVPAGMEFRGKLGDGIDIKHRGYVVAPPSIHPDGGRYEWLSSPFDNEVAELPTTWLTRMKKTGANDSAPPVQLHKSENSTTTSAYGAVAIEREIKAVKSAAEGERNNRLNLAAFSLGQLHAGGAIVDVQEELVQAAMDAGLPEHEARRTVDSGWSAGQSEPRRAPKDASGGSGEPGHGGAECDWEPPVGLEAGRLPEFPIASLPAPLAEYAAAVATAVQVPVDMPGVLTLGALSAACASRFVVEVTDGYVEPTNLYSVVAMDSGNRKSAAISRMIAPIEDYERQLREERKMPVAVERAEYDAVVKRLEETKREAAKAAPEDQPAALAAVREAAAELENRRMPVLPRLLVDDVTSEKLGSFLVEHGSIAVLSPEGGVFDVMGGRYSGEPNIDVYLKAHTGESLRVDRMNRPSEYVARPILTLCLTVQPVVLKRLAEKRDFRGRGLVARFLYSIPLSLLGRRAVNPPPVPADLSRAYEQLLRTLLVSAGGAIEEPRMLRLSGEAHTAWLLFCADHEPRLGDGGDFASLTDWAGKLPGAIIRIAALLHAAQFPSAPTDTLISAATMTSAIALGKYFTSHALAAFDIMGADPALEAARHILAWLGRVGASSFGLRNCFEAVKGKIKKTDELRTALAVLEEHGYIRRRAEERHEGPGRKPGPTYEVNPLWPQAQSASQNSQNAKPPGSPSNSANIANGFGPAEDALQTTDATQADIANIANASEPTEGAIPTTGKTAEPAEGAAPVTNETAAPAEGEAPVTGKTAEPANQVSDPPDDIEEGLL
ncbi:MAG: DUF3987 domain-containing protein [Polyangia bacterium]